MRMTVPLFGRGQKGKSSNVTAQSRINCYAEIPEESDRGQIVFYGTPGLELFVDFGARSARGLIAMPDDNIYFVVYNTLWEVNSVGVKTSRGTLTTNSGKVSMADNGTDILIVDGSKGYIFETDTNTFTQITDIDFPSNPETATFNNGRFIVNKGGTGEFYGSALYNGLSWAALDFATAESNPDNLIHVKQINGNLVLFGDISTEFWQDTGSAGFPYAWTNTLEWGLAARWSLGRFLDSYAFLAKNPIGEVIVASLSGHGVERISNYEIEHLINSYTNVADAVGFGYMLGGHPMYQISFPSAGFSWLYDGSTRLWSQLKSKDITRHRSELHANYLNQNIVTDYDNGKVYKLKSSVLTDNGDPIEMEIVSRHVFDSDKPMRIDSLQVNFEQGTGIATGQGVNPQAMLRVSKDGGHSWGNEIWAPIGKIGEYKARTEWRRLGLARDFTFQIRVSDPVKKVITGGNLIASSGDR